jgi:O-antigen ligase
MTALLTGGIGFQALGGESFGGRKYLFLLTAIAGYFAMTAVRIPPGKAGLFIGLFFLGALTNFIGDLFVVVDPSLYFIFLLFPPNFLSDGAGIELGTTRLSGLAGASTAFFMFMMARYGIRGIFLSGKPLRLIAFLVLSFAGLYGGFRITLITYLMIFGLQFFLEGLHRSRFLPVLLLASAMIAAISLPLVSRLPLTVQRTLAFLPLDIDPAMRADAQGSSEWRLRMWKAVLPQVPQYLFMGKGYAISPNDLLYMVGPTATTAISEDQWGAALAGDYHNGPLSVLIPFGIWGMLAFLWLLVASVRVVYRNYKYGEASLKTVNAFLLAMFISRIIMFFGIFGALSSDMMFFVGLLGLSVSLNGGVARAATVAAQPEPIRFRAPATFLSGARPMTGK